MLRLAVEGSKRARGIVASNYAQGRVDAHQEIISVGDEIGFGIELGAADRYLIRGVSFNMDDSTPTGSGFTNPFDLRSGSRTGAVQFSLVNTRNAPGLPVWTAPQGATVTGGTGGQAYVFDQPVGPDSGDEKTRRRDAVLERVAGADSDGVDSPAAAGVSFTGGKGDIALDDPLMAVLGVPLDAMVQNLGRTDNGYVNLGFGSNKALSQGFTTGSDTFGYRLQGIGVNIEGSGSSFPDGPTSVSVAVHADLYGKPGTKLVDLVSPTEYAAGHSFFEAPPGTNLEASTSYVLVWSHLGGTWHRLQKTASNNEDSGAQEGSSIADAFRRGADLDNLSVDSPGNALELAVYTEVNTETVVYIMEPPKVPFVPGVTGGGGAILRCSVPPSESCPTYEDDDLPAEITVWSATLTAGRISANFVGYRDDPIGSLSDTTLSYGGTNYTIDQFGIGFGLLQFSLSSELASTPTNLVLHVGTQEYPFSDAVYNAGTFAYGWADNVPTWAESDSVAVKITGPPTTPNAYGYRTIWTALMTVEQHPSQTTYFGRHGDDYGKITNDTIVDGRTDRGVIDDQFRYPWSGYKIVALVELGTFLQVEFDSASYPSADELAGWTLVLGGKELPFADATPVHATTPYRLKFTSYDPNWAAGDQLLVSIRTEDVQNRYGQVILKARRSTTVGDNGNIVYGKTHYTYPRQPDQAYSYARGDGRFGRGYRWDLQGLRVTTEKTGDTDPVWITATFRAPNAIGTGWTKAGGKDSSRISTRCSSGGFTTRAARAQPPTHSRSQRPLQKAASSGPGQAATSPSHGCARTRNFNEDT